MTNDKFEKEILLSQLKVAVTQTQSIKTLRNRFRYYINLYRMVFEDFKFKNKDIMNLLETYKINEFKDVLQEEYSSTIICNNVSMEQIFKDIFNDKDSDFLELERIGNILRVIEFNEPIENSIYKENYEYYKSAIHTDEKFVMKDSVIYNFIYKLEKELGHLKKYDN